MRTIGDDRRRCSYTVDPRVDKVCNDLAQFEVDYRFGSHFDYPATLYRCDKHLADTVSLLAVRSDEGTIDAVRRVDTAVVVRKSA